MKRRMNDKSNIRLVEGSKENAEESCKDLVNQCYAKNILKDYN